MATRRKAKALTAKQASAFKAKVSKLIPKEMGSVIVTKAETKKMEQSFIYKVDKSRVLAIKISIEPIGVAYHELIIEPGPKPK